MAPELPVAELICDKFRLMELAASEGLPIPRTWDPSAPVPDGVSWPVLLKGRIGLPFYRKAGKKVILCSDRVEYEEYTRQFGNEEWKGLVMAQELISDDKDLYTVSVGAYCVGGQVKTSWTGIKVREHPDRFGTATLARGIRITEAENYAHTLIKALQYTGICEIELLKDPVDNKFKLIEINPRTWLWVDLARASGVDLALLAWQDALGLNPVFPQSWEPELVWRNFYTDLWFGIGRVFRRKMKLQTYFRQMRGKRIHAVWSKEDPQPFIRMTLMLPYLMRNR